MNLQKIGSLFVLDSPEVRHGPTALSRHHFDTMDLTFQQISDLPWEFDSDDPESIQAIEQRLTASRRAATSTHPLAAGHRFHFQPPAHSFHPHNHPGMRPLPSFAFSSGPCTLTLESVIQEGLQWQSQVWTARVAHPEASNGLDAESRPLVVVKIIQPSLLRIPTVLNNNWKGLYVSPRFIALSEDCIYRTLRPVRGSAVPHYFGVHEVQMPNGELAWMMILEHIQGPTMKQWMRMHAIHVDPDTEGKCVLGPVEFAAWTRTIKDMVRVIVRQLSLRPSVSIAELRRR
ncbi:hypothetical protein BV25DRAFT_237086 [Artomyces pyxidatus]|uniref:Uncharacterized protein n=1 Tax=Artomyces pyxidatus TaxID=48021 RepID=A0ACB8T8H3_9AGAM|nr:hypothetical protein BV25DRAFT_237086 [Artomyces pyxidatus]